MSDPADVPPPAADPAADVGTVEPPKKTSTATLALLGVALVAAIGFLFYEFNKPQADPLEGKEGVVEHSAPSGP